MESSIARYFNEKVDALMGEDGRKPRLYSTLSLYQQDHNLTGLITNLKKVLNQPHLAELFDDIRTLIPTKHQLPYSRLAPHPPPAAPIVIRLNRTNSDASLGFAVRGGLEHGVGIYVSQVIPNSTAAKQGLQVGDEIVRINGFTISQAIHLEVLNLIRHRAELVLKVRHMGMLPVKEGEEVSWHYLDTDYTDSQEEAGDEDGEERLEEVKLFIHLPVGGILGCRVCSGPPGMEGIFVSSVRPNGYAEVAGLTPGDQILSVNGTSFINVTHGEALVALKASRNILLLIRKAAARELFLPSKAHVDWQGLPRNDNRPAPVTITPDENGNVNSTVPPPVGWVDEPLKQIDLIQQAIRVIEEKEVTVVALADPRSAVEVAAEVHPMPQSNSDSPGVSAGNTTLSSTHPSPTGSNTSSTGNLNKPIHQPIASNPSPTKPPTRVGITSSAAVPDQPPPLPKLRTKSEKTKPSVDELMDGKDSLRGLPRRHTVLVTPGEASQMIWKAMDEAHVTMASSEQAATIARLQPQSSSNMSKKGQSFRIQKPVLLHPTRGVEGEGTFGSIPEEEEDVYAEVFFNKDNFNPNRIFTNEQIAGREVQLVNITKEEYGGLGWVVEVRTGNLPHAGVMVVEIYEGGVIQRNGEIQVGDEIMMVDGHLLQRASEQSARKVLLESYKKAPKRPMQLVIAKSPPSTEPATEVYVD